MILYIVTLHFVGVHIILAVDSITTHNKSINQLNEIMRQSNNKDVDSIKNTTYRYDPIDVSAQWQR